MVSLKNQSPADMKCRDPEPIITADLLSPADQGPSYLADVRLALLTS